MAGLFQSDHDLDCLSNIQEDAKLGEEAGLYRPDEPDKLRKQFDDGVLVSLTDQYLSRVGKKPKDGNEAWYTVTYKLILLTAVAMQLGCQLPPSLRDFTSTKYRTTKLQRDGIAQMAKALRDYKDGTPYDFESKSLVETANMPDFNEDDRLFPGSMLINTSSPEWGPGHKEMMQNLAKKFRERIEAGEYGYSADACGNCGKKPADGTGELKRCGRCGSKSYCSKEWYVRPLLTACVLLIIQTVRSHTGPSTRRSARLHLLRLDPEMTVFQC